MTSTTRVVCFVPIKLSSERLPGKMLMPLGDGLLCTHIFITLLEAKKVLLESTGLIDFEVHCYCSSSLIAPHLPAGVQLTMRPDWLDGNKVIGMDIYQTFAAEIPADVYVLCHATSPFMRAESVVEGLKAVVDGAHDSAFSAERIQTFSWYQNRPINYSLDHIPRTQELEVR